MDRGVSSCKRSIACEQASQFFFSDGDGEGKPAARISENHVFRPQVPCRPGSLSTVVFLTNQCSPEVKMQKQVNKQ